MSGNISIKMEGDWDKLMNMLDQMPTEMARQVDRGMHNAANEYRKIVRRNIRTHGVRLGYTPSSSALSGSYAAYKRRNAAYQGLLMFSGRIYRSVSVMKTKRGNYTVGVPRTDKSKGKTGLTTYEAAYLLEHGTKYAQKYPVFRDSFSRKDQFGGKKRILRFIQRNISVHYRKKYGIKLMIR